MRRPVSGAAELGSEPDLIELREALRQARVEMIQTAHVPMALHQQDAETSITASPQARASGVVLPVSRGAVPLLRGEVTRAGTLGSGGSGGESSTVRAMRARSDALHVAATITRDSSGPGVEECEAAAAGIDRVLEAVASGCPE